MYIFKHTPKDAYTTLSEMFQQKFKHSKFKHLMELPIETRRPSKMVTTCICFHLVALHFFFECVSEWCFWQCLFVCTFCSFSSCLSWTRHWLHTCLLFLFWLFFIHKLKCSFGRVFLQRCRMHRHSSIFLRGAVGAVQHSRSIPMLAKSLVCKFVAAWAFSTCIHA